MRPTSTDITCNLPLVPAARPTTLHVTATNSIAQTPSTFMHNSTLAAQHTIAYTASTQCLCNPNTTSPVHVCTENKVKGNQPEGRCSAAEAVLHHCNGFRKESVCCSSHPPQPATQACSTSQLPNSWGDVCHWLASATSRPSAEALQEQLGIYSHADCCCQLCCTAALNSVKCCLQL